jgi:hypothetical protein
MGYLKQALTLDPQFALAWVELGWMYAREADWGWAPLAQGRGEEAFAEALREPEEVWRLRALARGEADVAFEWLERAHAQREPAISEMKTLPPLRSLHADPRWDVFLRKMGLAD